MGRPPTKGTPAFRFTPAEVVEMETILQDHNNMMPAREVLVSLADKFSNSPERRGIILVQTKQIWNWFQNKRYAIRARSSKTPTKLTVSSMQSASTVAPLAPVVPTVPPMQETPALSESPSVPTTPVVSKEDNLPASRLPQSAAASPGELSSNNISMEFEARSAKDGAWYDVSAFISLKNLEAGDPEVLVRFSGFGPEEDEWINVRKNVRYRSLPCETSECVAVLPGDLILCFQDGKEQSLYFDARVLDAQRRRHDVRGCRCRFLVRYDHDQSEEIVQLRKICRRPETDYRLQQLHAMNELSADQGKSASATQHKTVTSVDPIQPVDLSFSKTGIRNSIAQSVQSPHAPNMLVKSSMNEELKGPTDCSTDKTAEDMNAALGSTQHSHPELTNLDPGNEAGKNMLEEKDETDHMLVDEPLEKPSLSLEITDVMPMCGTDTTAKTCNTDEETDGNVITKPIATEVAKNKASPADGTDPAAEDGQDDSEQMVVESGSATNDGRTSIDLSQVGQTSSHELLMDAEAKISKTSVPVQDGIDIVYGGGPGRAFSVSISASLESNVACTSAVVAAGKADVDMSNATQPCYHPGDDSATNK